MAEITTPTPAFDPATFHPPPFSTEASPIAAAPASTTSSTDYLCFCTSTSSVFSSSDVTASITSTTSSFSTCICTTTTWTPSSSAACASSTCSSTTYSRRRTDTTNRWTQTYTSSGKRYTRTYDLDSDPTDGPDLPNDSPTSSYASTLGPSAVAGITVSAAAIAFGLLTLLYIAIRRPPWFARPAFRGPAPTLGSSSSSGPDVGPGPGGIGIVPNYGNNIGIVGNRRNGWEPGQPNVVARPPSPGPPPPPPPPVAHVQLPDPRRQRLWEAEVRRLEEQELIRRQHREHRRRNPPPQQTEASESRSEKTRPGAYSESSSSGERVELSRRSGRGGRRAEVRRQRPVVNRTRDPGMLERE